MAEGMTEPLYTIEILRLAASIPHLGRLADAQSEVELRSPTCGSRVRIGLRLNEAGRVTALGQEVEACAFGQASAALMGAHAIGRSPAELKEALLAYEDWLAGGRDDPGEWPGLHVLAPARPKIGRHGAMLLPFRAMVAAMLAVPETATPE
jgi:NifU-like protein involved in Fe-S cluster formation